MQINEHHASPSEPIDLLSHPTRDDRRVDLDGQVTLHYVDLGDCVTERTQNVSTTGMFVRTSSLRPPGTVLRFDLDLANGLEPIQGRAEVVWVRRQGDGLFRPAGLGVRFVGLDAESRQLIRWTVEHRTRELRKILHLDAVVAEPAKDAPGSGRSDLDDLRMELEGALGGESLRPAGSQRVGQGESSALAELRTEVDLALREVLESSGALGVERGCEYLSRDADLHEVHPYAGCASASSPAGVGRRLWRIASAVPLVPLAALSLYLLSPAPEPASATPQAAEAILTEPAPLELAPIELAPAVQEPTGGDLSTVEDDLEQLIMTWAEAWSQQRARSYLACYSPDFQPPNAMDRDAWEALREERILKPRHIRIEVRDLETEILSAEHARVDLTQTYSSDHYRDTVRKTFDLVHGEEGWKILAERVEAEL